MSLRSSSTVGCCDWEVEGIAHKTLGRISFFGGDLDACHIGLTQLASITLLTYDLQVTYTPR